MKKKIAIFDHNQGKFTDDFAEKMRKKGHEVKREYAYNPELVDWADVIWIDGCDNNAKVATTVWDEHPDWYMGAHDMTGKKVIVRAIDIEVWYGHHKAVDWQYVTDVIFIAPHIQKLVEADIDFSKYNTNTHLIPCGVDMDKHDFVYKKVGKKIAWVCEKWPTKGIDYALQIMALLPKDFELHTIGGWNDRYEWEKAYQEDFIKRHEIKFFDDDWVEDKNEWLADKDFILSCSKKEAFGYNIAEGMSKGLIPIIHRFYGCDDIWDINVWDTVQQAADAIQIAQKNFDNKERRQYREYLIDKGYDLDTMLKRFEEVIDDKA